MPTTFYLHMHGVCILFNFRDIPAHLPLIMITLTVSSYIFSVLAITAMLCSLSEENYSFKVSLSPSSKLMRELPSSRSYNSFN